MWPYVLLILIPVIMQHFRYKSTPEQISGDEKNRRAMIVFWSILAIMLILRHKDIGRDLDNYEIIFNMISHSDWKTALGRSAEFGYNFLNKFVSLFTTNFYWIMVLTSVFSVYFVARAYIRYSEDSSLTIAIFVIMSNFVLLFSGLRQAIAISIGFVAYELTKRKKIFFFILIVLVAMLFHTSAFMLFFMYPLYHLKITRNWLFFVVPILGFIFIFNRQIFGTLTAILDKFTKYEGVISSTGAYTMLILFCGFAVFAYLIPEESEMDDDTIGLRNFLLFSVVIQMFAPLHSIAMRMNYYYIIFIPLLIPKIITYRSTRWKLLAEVGRHIMVVFFILYFFWSAPRDNVLDTFPYKFFWQ